MPDINGYDVCVVGSGPAGAFIANLVAKRGHKVVVVDAGNDLVDSNVDENFDFGKSGLKDSVNFGFSHQVGGSSNLWGGGLAKMDDIDLKSRKEYDFLSWPVDKYELQHLYKRVAKIIGIQTNDSRTFNNVSSEAKDLSEFSNLELREMICMGNPFKTKTLIEGVKNITIIRNHEVCNILLNKEKTTVTAMKAFNKETSGYVEIKAERFVLAAGTISNVRVLLHSLEKFFPSSDALLSSIGVGFSTHPKGNMGKIKFNKRITENSPFVKIVQTKFGSIRYYFGLNKNFLTKHKLLNHCLRVESVYALRMVRYLDYCKRFLVYLPFVKNSTVFMDLISKLGIKIFQTLENIAPSVGSDGSFEIRGFLDQASKKTNTISLSSKKSVSGLPLAKLEWQYDDKDWENVDRYMLAMKAELKQNNIGVLEYIRPSPADFTGLHSHFLGGTRVGEAPSNSVVDSDLKVHNISNLYISGPSVFPSFGYANPFFSISALSVRLADHLNELARRDLNAQ